MKKLVFNIATVFCLTALFLSCDKDDIAPPTNLTETYLAHYPLDGNANDVGIDSLHGQIIGSPEPTVDRLGNEDGALKFDGQEDYLILPDELTFEKDFTITCWVNFKNTANKTWGLFSKGATCPDGNPQYEGKTFEFSIGPAYGGCQQFASKNYFNARGVSGGGNFFDQRIVASSTEQQPHNEWLFIGWSFDADSNTFHLSINGTPFSSNELSHFYEKGGSSDCEAIPQEEIGSLFQSTAPLLIGATENYCGFNYTIQNHFKGSLDDLRFYDQKLTDDEIDNLFKEQ